MNVDGEKIGIIGCGVMGSTIVNALLQSKTVKPECIHATILEGHSTEDLEKKFPGVHITSGQNEKCCDWATIIIVCLKPHLVETYLETYEYNLEEKIVVSIAAGKSLTRLREYISSKVNIVRVMPNTPCQIGEGMVFISTECKSQIVEKVKLLFSGLGLVRVVEESQMDAVTALGGSGPAFACLFMEALADGGVLCGLSRDLALEIAAQTVQGTAKMILRKEKHPAQIREEVCTPGGCTIKGLTLLEEGRLRGTVTRTIQQTMTAARGTDLT